MSESTPTPSQRVILQLLANGLSQKQIAYQLGINVKTMRVYCQRMKLRLGFETLYQLVATAVAEGWVQVPTWNLRKIAMDRLDLNT